MIGVTLFRGLESDCRLAFRRLVREWPSSVAIAGILALGIGATTAVFALFDQLLFKPIPGVPHEEQLVWIGFLQPDGGSGVGARSALEAMRDAGRLAGLEKLADRGWSASVPVSAFPEVHLQYLRVGFTFSHYFATLGVRAKSGRLPTDAELELEGSSVAVISEHLWRRSFADDERVLGRSLSVGGHPFTIVGVVEEFRGLGRPLLRLGDTDAWIPATSSRRVTGGEAPPTVAVLFGRTGGNASLEGIEARLGGAHANAAIGSPDARLGDPRKVIPTVRGGLGPSDSTHLGGLRLFALSVGSAMLLFLVAAVNAAALALVRFSRRSTDVAIRSAVGGSRLRIGRQYVCEALVLAATAGLAGLAIATAVARGLSGVRLTSGFPVLTNVVVDARVVLACGALCVVAAATFGALPAVLTSRTDCRLLLDRYSSKSPARQRLRYGLVAIQFALCAVLATGAAVLGRSLATLSATDTGMALDDVHELMLRPDRLKYGAQKSAAVLREVTDKLRGAGFAVATSAPGPLEGSSSKVTFRSSDGVPIAVPSVRQLSVSPEYFALLEIPFLGGRSFTPAEAAQAESIEPMPAIVSESLAAALFGGRDAVGKGFMFERVAAASVIHRWAVVVGVVGDIGQDNIRAGMRPAIYHTRQASAYPVILAKSSNAQGAATVHRLVREVDKGLPVESLQMLTDRRGAAMSEDRTVALVSAAIASVAILIAIGAVAVTVGQFVHDKTHELAVMVALGATPISAMMVAVRGVIIAAVVGVLAGCALFATVSSVLESRVYGVQAFDRLSVVAVSVMLVGIAAASALAAGFRVTRLEAWTSLRSR